MRAHEKKVTPPDQWDMLLAYAEAIVTSEQCAQCGRPNYVCQNDDNDIDFRVTEIVCNAMAKKERADKAKGDKHKPTPGAITSLDTIVYSRTPVSEFRKPWLKKRAKERKVRDKATPKRPRDKPPGQSS